MADEVIIPTEPIDEEPKEITIVEGEYKVGDRVKVTWRDIDETEYTSYGTLTEIAEDGNYIIEIERDVDGIRAGTMVVATKVQPIEAVIQTGGVENIPGIEKQQYVTTQKNPNMTPNVALQNGRPYYSVQTARRRRVRNINDRYNDSKMTIY